MKFGLLYEIEVPRPWGETSVANCFWEALEQVTWCVDMMLFLVQAGNVAHRDILASLRRFGAEVLPHFTRRR